MLLDKIDGLSQGFKAKYYNYHCYIKIKARYISLWKAQQINPFLHYHVTEKHTKCSLLGSVILIPKPKRQE